MSKPEPLTESLELLASKIVFLSELVLGSFAKLERISKRQSETIERQEQNITRLVGIAERLLDRDK